MTRVSPPELARELPGPHASTRTTRAPRRASESAEKAPKAPAPTTITRFPERLFRAEAGAGLRAVPPPGARAPRKAAPERPRNTSRRDTRVETRRSARSADFSCVMYEPRSIVRGQAGV